MISRILPVLTKLCRAAGVNSCTSGLVMELSTVGRRGVFGHHCDAPIPVLHESHDRDRCKQYYQLLAKLPLAFFQLFRYARRFQGCQNPAWASTLPYGTLLWLLKYAANTFENTKRLCFNWDRLITILKGKKDLLNLGNCRGYLADCGISLGAIGEPRIDIFYYNVHGGDNGQGAYMLSGYLERGRLIRKKKAVIRIRARQTFHGNVRPARSMAEIPF
ncbi:hypothetical protein BDZ94DRAFT_312884 [Collybia nuda]|uniref:Uncharacterized protein n=1 Tax=Collybia nuda TaxID=64659 RepID=A0A9P6CC73_9AGAR|nr:hypothetical protein BDZ94DRAFT_312884 [Collybia nuda]